MPLAIHVPLEGTSQRHCTILGMIENSSPKVGGPQDEGDPLGVHWQDEEEGLQRHR